jgi:hypothetical protein
MPWWRAKPPPPPPPEPSALLVTVDLFEWQLLLAIIALHSVLSLGAYAWFGDRRNEVAVTGGSAGDKGSQRPSLVATLVAYNLIAVMYAVYCASVGTASWFDGTAAAIGGSLEERLYGTSEPFARLASATIAYEVYNTVAVLFIGEYRNAQFIGHHATTLALGLMSKAPYMHYYGTFFFGLSAISSVPLATIELAKACGAEAVIEVSTALFCVAFLTFRTVYWPIEAYKFWCDELATLVGGSAPVHSWPAHIFLLVANIGLTGLQFYWTTLIFKGVADKLAPAKQKAK